MFLLSSDYHFVTHWNFEARIEDVYDLISDSAGYEKWWKGPSIRVEQLVKGDASGAGQVDQYQLAGKLPYTLCWNLCCTQAVRPFRIEAAAEGDLRGRGIWTFEQHEKQARVTFDWQVRVEKKKLRYLSFVFRPFYEWNHHWVMKTWEESLRRELIKKGSHGLPLLRQ